MRITPENIEKLEKNQIFVFGSNLIGIHGAGAANTALNKFNATYGVAEGLQGQCYAIPTKDHKIQTMSVDKIKPYVDRFIRFAKDYSTMTFLVTEIGCGLAEYSPSDIAPLFKDAVELDNVYLPKRFWEILNN